MMVSVNLSTVSVGAFALLAVFAFLYWRQWRQDSTRIEFPLLSAATAAGSAGAFLSIFSSVDFGLFTVGLAQALMLLSAAVAWQALRAFDHRSLNLKHATAGPLFFFLLTASAPFLQVDVNARFQFGMLIGAVYTALAARELMVSETEERLSNRPFTYKWFGSMAALLVLSGIAAYVWPLGTSDVAAASQPLWFSGIVLAMFLHTVIAPVSMFLLVRDRLLVEHNWAAATDMLTGLANRGTFLDLLQTLSMKIRGEGAFLYVDVDHVKRINDRFGHSGGDHVLKSCAELIQRELPEHALLGRLAGAEFAAYVPFCKVEEAETLGNIIRDSVAQQMFFLGDEMVEVTVSVGVAHGAVQVTPDELLKRADAALHTAKVRGRNSVVVWHEGESPAFA